MRALLARQRVTAFQRVIGAAALAVLGVVCAASPALACVDGSPNEFGASDVTATVVRGLVTSQSAAPDGVISYVVRVDHVLAGDAPAEIRVAQEQSNCSTLDLRTDQEVVVAASSTAGDLGAATSRVDLWNGMVWTVDAAGGVREVFGVGLASVSHQPTSVSELLADLGLTTLPPTDAEGQRHAGRPSFFLILVAAVIGLVVGLFARRRAARFAL